MSDALFLRDRDHFVPSELARGPWSPDALHGGPVAALLAGLAESLPQPGPMHPARMTLELLRPVPLAPLRGAARVLRPGRKLMLAEATPARRRARGGARHAAAAAPRGAAAAGGARGRRRGGAAGARGRPAHASVWDAGLIAYHRDAVEHRVVRGSWGMPGPCTDWIRLRVPVVAGETPSPLQRVAAAADFGNGISAALPFGAWRFINADLTIHLQRLPRGEWVCLDAVTWPEGAGVGLAESELFDEAGRLGRSLQSLLLERG